MPHIQEARRFVRANPQATAETAIGEPTRERRAGRKLRPPRIKLVVRNDRPARVRDGPHAAVVSFGPVLAMIEFGGGERRNRPTGRAVRSSASGPRLELLERVIPVRKSAHEVLQLFLVISGLRLEFAAALHEPVSRGAE